MDDVYGIVGSLIDGKYRVEAAVADGGFGVVYRAEHASLHTPVALKLLRLPEGLEESVRDEFFARFAEEARMTARLDHPAIVRVIDFGVSTVMSGERVPWMALEWLEGRTLAEHLEARRGRGGVKPTEALATLRPALEAVAWAHARGVVHRDLKPSNLMLVDGVVPLRVLDFGIARTVDTPVSPPSGETRSRSSTRAFSPAYASPEQLGGTRTGPWTDVHALGLIFTELLTDEAPYDAGDDPDTLLSLTLSALSTERPTPARRDVDVGPWEPVIARAVSLRPGDRYPDAGALLAALDAISSQPAHPRLSDTYPAHRVAITTPSMRSRSALVVASLVAVTGVGALIASQHRAPSERRVVTPAPVTDASREHRDEPVDATVIDVAEPAPDVSVTDSANSDARPAHSAPRAAQRSVRGSPRDASAGSPLPHQTPVIELVPGE